MPDRSYRNPENYHLVGHGQLVQWTGKLAVDAKVAQLKRAVAWRMTEAWGLASVVTAVTLYSVERPGPGAAVIAAGMLGAGLGAAETVRETNQLKVLGEAIQTAQGELELRQQD